MEESMDEKSVSIFCSEALEEALANPILEVSYSIPESCGVQFISENKTGMPLPDQSIKAEPIKPKTVIGMGSKRKLEAAKPLPTEPRAKKAKKPKTLAEKREQLKEDILKYGLAAMELKYPRQVSKPSVVPINSGPRPEKVLPAPQLEMTYSEIPAEKILKPFSHFKYIKQPSKSRPVYIKSRKGLVPLASLKKNSSVLLPSAVNLLEKRDLQMGRPYLYVNDTIGRVLAIGGSRSIQNQAFKILHIPKISPKNTLKSALQFMSFQMDSEYANFAANALVPPKKSTKNTKIDIRIIKRLQKSQKKSIAYEKKVLNNLYSRISSCKMEFENSIKNSLVEVHNSWENEKRGFINPLPDPEGEPIKTDEFKQSLKNRNEKILSGYDYCDTLDCFCYESVTPGDSAIKKDELKKEELPPTADNLKKVKRALKTLGVNLLEFSDEKGSRNSCTREYCLLGCVCESIHRKPLLPTHCGKLECMFRCFCSEDSLQKFSGARKVGISPAGFANLQENTHRHLAAEERKFHNTVVTTGGGRDLIVVSSRQKRERKIPTRYQDSKSFSADPLAKDEPHKNSVESEFTNGKNADFTCMKLTLDGIRDKTINKCNVLLPKISIPENILINQWCLFHCQYSCPCFRLKNPLDYGPDMSRPRNVAIRSKPIKSKILPEISEIRSTEIKQNDKNYLLDDNNCSRTYNWKINPSKKLKIPHKYVKPNPPIDTDLVKFKVGDTEHTIDLNMKPKDTVMYVNWQSIKEGYNKGHIKVWFYSKLHKPLFFVTKKTGKPYLTYALDVKNLVRHSENLSLTPDLVKQLIDKDTKYENCYGMLKSNGLAWEITGLLRKKSIETIPTKKPNPPKIVNEMTESPYPVNMDLPAQKLPMGQNFVSVQTPSTTMQIKLPLTSKMQHWCSLKVVGITGSIQCPDSSLSLKSAVLKQAAELSGTEKTTVRIPIPVTGEINSFGVYAVPGLATHIFVGPFTNREKSSEVVCLDTPTNDDDDIMIIPASSPTDLPTNRVSISSSSNRRKQRLNIKLDEIDRLNNEKLVTSLVENAANRAVNFGERKTKRKVYSRPAIEGSTPQIVSIQSLENDVQIEHNGSFNVKCQAEKLKKVKVLPKPFPYINLPQSAYGKIVLGRLGSGELVNINMDFANLKTFTVLKGQNRYTFAHPSFDNHVVLCQNYEDVKNWMLEYNGLNHLISFSDDNDIKIIETKKTKHEEEEEVIPLFPNESEMLNSSSVTDDYTEQLLLIMELKKLLFSNYLDNKITKQIAIDEAKITINDLKIKCQNQEQTKKVLLNRRSQLFDDFTSKLKGLPTDVKKRFVASLKEGLKKSSPKRHRLENIESYPEKNRYESKKKNISEPSNGVVNEHKQKTITAFVLFAKDQKSKIISEGLPMSKLSKSLADSWINLPEERKNFYREKALKLKSEKIVDSIEYKHKSTMKNALQEKNRQCLTKQQVVEIDLD